jgi:hypothetical protein
VDPRHDHHVVEARRILPKVESIVPESVDATTHHPSHKRRRGEQATLFEQLHCMYWCHSSALYTASPPPTANRRPVTREGWSMREGDRGREAEEERGREREREGWRREREGGGQDRPCSVPVVPNAGVPNPLFCRLGLPRCDVVSTWPWTNDASSVVDRSGTHTALSTLVLSDHRNSHGTVYCSLHYLAPPGASTSPPLSAVWCGSKGGRALVFQSADVV